MTSNSVSNLALRSFLDHCKTSGLCAKSSVEKNHARGIRGSLGFVLQTYGLHPMKHTVVVQVRIDEDDLDDFRQSPWITKRPEDLLEDVHRFFADARSARTKQRSTDPIVLELSPWKGKPIVYVSTTEDPEVYLLIWFPLSHKTRVLTESLSSKVFHGSSDDETFSRLLHDSEYRGPLFEARTTYETMNLSEDLLQIFRAVREFTPSLNDAFDTDTDTSSESSESSSDSSL